MTVPTSVGSCHKIGPFPNGQRVATFACVYADGHRKGIDDANPAAVELAANARLIAAAPELLASLRELVQLEADGRTERESSIEYWERARSAIAKATGVAP
jgi:hypothetical protein